MLTLVAGHVRTTGAETMHVTSYVVVLTVDVYILIPF
jgi:hypothetical protein